MHTRSFLAWRRDQIGTAVTEFAAGGTQLALRVAVADTKAAFPPGREVEAQMADEEEQLKQQQPQSAEVGQ
jgi:hypothetical protein